MIQRLAKTYPLRSLISQTCFYEVPKIFPEQKTRGQIRRIKFRVSIKLFHCMLEEWMRVTYFPWELCYSRSQTIWSISLNRQGRGQTLKMRSYYFVKGSNCSL